MDDPRLRAAPIRTARLRLEPLRVEHASEAAAAFDDIALHAYIGGEPASAAALRARFERQVVGRSPDGAEDWLNWIVRRADTDELIGTVQATVEHVHGASGAAEVAWVVAVPHQGHGFAREAAAGMVSWLREQRVGSVLAHVHPQHGASAGVARAIGLRPTGTMVDGEERWSTA